MKRVLIIYTGGTIGMTRTENGYAPRAGYFRAALDAIQDLHAPEMPEWEFYELSPLLDSSNMTVREWNCIAELIAQKYDDYDGFVVLHGTDTMAYTAAALSYLIQRSPKPIVLTGAQKPIGFDTTDSRQNLRDAFACACGEGMHGVCIVFNGRVILGTRARKTHSKSFDAFSSINYPNIADVRDGRILRYIEPEHGPKPEFYTQLETRVGLLKLIPGTEPELLEYMLGRSRALVIESFGVGGLPCYEQADFLSAASAWSSAGKPIVITTQVPHEGSDLAVYQVGARVAAQPGILQAYTMTAEAVVTKLMWILPQTRDLAQIKRLFYTPIACDLLLFEEHGQHTDESN